MGHHHAGGVGSLVAAVINPAAGAVAAGTQIAGLGSNAANILSTATNPLAGAAGALTNTLTAKPGTPGTPDLPGMPAQAHDAVTTVSGYNMKLSQQLAMSAGGTLFSTPSQLWGGGRIGNIGGGGRSLLGA